MCEFTTFAAVALPHPSLVQTNFQSDKKLSGQIIAIYLILACLTQRCEEKPNADVPSNNRHSFEGQDYTNPAQNFTLSQM